MKMQDIPQEDKEGIWLFSSNWGVLFSNQGHAAEPMKPLLASVWKKSIKGLIKTATTRLHEQSNCMVFGETLQQLYFDTFVCNSKIKIYN